MYDVPELLNIPPKLLPIIDSVSFVLHDSILLEGGRGSGKSQSVARLLVYLAEKRKVRIVCGRELQLNIDESVHALLSDIITNYNLNFQIQKNKITHRDSGSEIFFKGFREQGKVNIKGLEGADILWIDEAEAITKGTLDIIMPTIRKDNSLAIFTMNRFLRNDAVYSQLSIDIDCLHINANYYDNPFFPQRLQKEMEKCKIRSEKEYNHIWLGQPLAQADDYLFNVAKLDKARILQPFGDLFFKQTVMGIDIAGKGDDICCTTLLDRVSDRHWKLAVQEHWDEPDTMVSTGKIVYQIGKYKPDIIIIDIGGMGYPVFNRLQEIGVKNIFAFDGAGKSTEPHLGNQRADGYHLLNEYLEQEWLIMDSPETIKELETIRYKFNSNGKIYLVSKEEMKKKGIESPDRADSLMMAIYGIKHFLAKKTRSDKMSGHTIKRVNKRKKY